MAIITRWSYKRGGRKAGFHCIITETKFEIKQQQDTVKISQEYFYRHHNIDIINVDMRI